MQQNIQTEVSLDVEYIKDKIYIIRGKKVMFDKDLALLYGVATKVLNQSVNRNEARFPEDFMFRLTKEEAGSFSKSQIVTLKKGSGSNIKYAPLVFTEQGIAMLSAVLNSPRAIQVSIQIVRVFIKIREMIDVYKELREKVEEMEKKNEINFKEVFTAIRLLINKDKKPRGKMGFDTGI